MTATRVSHSPVLARNVHRDGEGPRSSREVSLRVKGQEQINGVHGQARAGLAALQPGPSSQTSPSAPTPSTGGSAPAGAPHRALWQPLPHGTTAEGAAVVLSWPQAQGGNPNPLPHTMLCDSSWCTWKSRLHSMIMWAKPCVAARFSLSSL